MTEDFDDMGVYRRKVEKLEQTIATMALEIGVLKQERAHLYFVVRDLLECYLKTKEWNTIILKAQATLNEIKIL